MSENAIAVLRAALVRVVGTDDPKELEAMILVVNEMTLAPEADRLSMLIAIQAMLTTQDVKESQQNHEDDLTNYALEPMK